MSSVGYLVEDGALWDWGIAHSSNPTPITGSSLVCIPAEIVPLVGGMLARLQGPGFWATDTDRWAGYQVLAELQEQLMANLNCIEQLVESSERIYRLLDTSLNGTQYTVAGDVISPPIAAVPPVSANVTNSMRAHISRIWQLLENEVAGVTAGPGESIENAPALPDNQSTRATLRAMQGILDPNWFGGGNPATLANVVTALKIGSDAKKQTLLDKLSQILGLGSDIASIFSLIEQLLADTVDAGEEGAVVGVLIASTMAQAAIAGAQAQQIDRLINAIDGGAEPPPDTNVITELEAINTKLV